MITKTTLHDRRLTNLHISMFTLTLTHNTPPTFTAVNNQDYKFDARITMDQS